MEQIKETKEIKESYFNKCWKGNFNLNKIFEYSEYLTKFTLLKRTLYSMMAGFFIGIVYLVYFICKTNFGSVTGPIIGSLLFPFGIFAILYIGGNLYTSSTMMILSVLRGKYKFINFIFQLAYTWFCNMLGSFLAMGIAWLIVYNNLQLKVVAVDTAITKINSPWFSVLASSFLCNILVVGAVYVYNVAESKVVKFLFVYLTIALFAISGFQHSIANQFSISLGLTYFDDENVMAAYNASHTEFHHTQAWGWGAFFLYNEPIVSLGNALSGMFIPLIYVASEYKQKNKLSFKNKQFFKNKDLFKEKESKQNSEFAQ